MAASKDFFSSEDQNRIMDSIQRAEKDTSGEIQVHIENKCKGDVLERAAKLFEILKMDNTVQRNGVLFYLAVHDRKFAILGDKGINEKVPENFWDEIKEHMQLLFREGRYVDGLTDGIRMAGEALGKHFPYQKDDINELPDELSFGNN